MKKLELYLEKTAKEAKEAAGFLNRLCESKKNDVLRQIAQSLIDSTDEILKANGIDLAGAVRLRDRLTLNSERISAIAKSVEIIADLPCPVGEVLERRTLENGLEIIKKRVPFGVVACIYEARPNVTIDIFAMCFKTSNACILKGGSDALNTNRKIVEIIRKILKLNKIPAEAVTLVEDAGREASLALMKLKDYIDVLVPRGGAGLIKNVAENSTIPIIETGTGNCHVYVDEFADFDMAVSIILNAKTSRVSVCNSCESLVIHRNIADRFLPLIEKELQKAGVEISRDEADFGVEFLDYKISIAVADSLSEAISHINKYSTRHSESIITDNHENAQKFLNEVDSACVYVNASTRFTDGGEFGMGAEVGISTQKLHARGPMGLESLTSYKYIVYGSGQIRV